MCSVRCEAWCTTVDLHDAVIGMSCALHGVLPATQCYCVDDDIDSVICDKAMNNARQHTLPTRPSALLPSLPLRVENSRALLDRLLTRARPALAAGAPFRIQSL